MEPARHYISTPTVQLSFLEWKYGVEPLLLLHGLGDHALVWTELAQQLPGFHILAPDLPGHGESGKPETGAYTFPEVIAILEALMEARGWPAAHILGHSWTGKLVPIWAQTSPQRFLSMIVVDPIFIIRMPAFMKLSFPILFRVLDSMKGMGPFSSLAEAEEKARSLRQYRGWSPFQQMVFRESLEQKPDGRWGSKFTVTARNLIFEDVMRVAGVTTPIDIPTLFLKPEHGVNRREWQTRPFTTFCSDLEVRTIPGNHWPFLVEPEAFHQAVSDFLRVHTRSLTAF